MRQTRIAVIGLGERAIDPEAVVAHRIRQRRGGDDRLDLGEPAVAAVRAGGSVAFAACLGDDHYGRTMAENFRKDGIDTSCLGFIPDRPCGTALIFFDDAGENVIGVAPGTNDDLTPERARGLDALVAESAWVLLQMEIPPETNREILALAARHGTKAWTLHLAHSAGQPSKRESGLWILA